MSRLSAAKKGELAAAMVGKIVLWGQKVRHTDKGDTKFPCLVVNASFRYGTWDLLIIPLVGQGSRWVNYTAVAAVDTPMNKLSNAGIDDLQHRADLCGSQPDDS